MALHPRNRSVEASKPDTSIAQLSNYGASTKYGSARRGDFHLASSTVSMVVLPADRTKVSNEYKENTADSAKCQVANRVRDRQTRRPSQTARNPWRDRNMSLAASVTLLPPPVPGWRSQRPAAARDNPPAIGRFPRATAAGSQAAATFADTTRLAATASYDPGD